MAGFNVPGGAGAGPPVAGLRIPLHPIDKKAQEERQLDEDMDGYFIWTKMDDLDVEVREWFRDNPLTVEAIGANLFDMIQQLGTEKGILVEGLRKSLAAEQWPEELEAHRAFDELYKHAYSNQFKDVLWDGR